MANYGTPVGTSTYQSYPNPYEKQQQQQQQPGYAYGQPSSPTQAGQTPHYVGPPPGWVPPHVVEGQPIYTNYAAQGENAGLIKGKFVSQGYQDVWAAVLFLVQLLGTIVWAIFSVSKYPDDFKDLSTTSGGVSTSSADLHRDLRVYLPAASGASFGAAVLVLLLIRAFPRGFILLANIITLLANIGLIVYSFSALKQTYVGIIWVVLTLFQCLWLFLVRHRIPFSGALLAHGVTIVTRHFGTIVTSFGSIVVLVVYCVLWGLMVTPTASTIERYQNRNVTYYSSYNQPTVSGSTYGACLLFLFMFFWTSQCIVYVVHVTCCGVAATWYYVGAANMPSNPTVSSLKRALTTSFGSICFGALLIAILKLMRMILRSSRTRGDNFAKCIIECLLLCIERLIEYFNVYAFTFVAIYGSSYVEAAQQTWELIKHSWISAIINDNLVFPVLTLTSLIDSLVIAIIFGFASHSIVIGVLSFCISYVIHVLFMRAVYSAIVTLFVCISEAPQVMETQNPEFHREIVEALAIMRQPACEC